MSMTLREEIEQRWRDGLRTGSRVIVKRPFTEERVEGVVVERGRDVVIVAACGEELQYGIQEVEKAS